MKSTLVMLLMICCLLSLAGCLTYGPLKTEKQITGYMVENRPTKEEVHAMADANTKILTTRYAEEAQLRSTPFPAVCLALSGGGIRSAAYSAGALKAITEEKQQLDIISAVSGGSYAASWYHVNMAHALRNGMEPISIFSDDYRYRFTRREFLDSTKSLVQIFIRIPFSIVQGFLQNVFAGEMTQSWYADFYAEQINDMFYEVSRNPSMPNVGDDIKRFGLPNLIINATIQGTYDKESLPLASRIFEFTPFRYGSDGYGYLESTNPIPYPHECCPLQQLKSIVGVSGAAPDVELEANGTLYWIRRYFAATLGMGVTSYDEDRHKDIFKGKYWFLSDGGHSENLGAFSLIRRRCSKILIVDAEWDSTYKFEAYTKLKEALSKHKITFAVPHIEDNQKGTGEWKFPVMEGTVSTVPVYSGQGEVKVVDESVLNVVYFKLSLGTCWPNKMLGCREDVLQYPKNLTPNLYHCMDFPWFWHWPGCFPQIPTSDQGISSQILESLFKLGYIHVKTYLTMARAS